MAEIKNSFLRSKMNKDLDDRLIPNGEYRDANNISVGKSEDDDIGALENILGNTLVQVSNTGNPNFTNSNVIGFFANVSVNEATYVTNRSNVAGTVNVTIPADLYPGTVLMPDARTNVPITVFSVQWTDTGVTPNTINSHRWAVLERYKPGDTAIGNVLADAGFVSLTS